MDTLNGIKAQVNPETQELTSDPPSYSASDIVAIGTALANLGNHMQLLENDYGQAITDNAPSFVVDTFESLLSAYHTAISALVAPLTTSGASS